jgi:hypothetical protein
MVDCVALHTSTSSRFGRNWVSHLMSNNHTVAAEHNSVMGTQWHVLRDGVAAFVG